MPPIDVPDFTLFGVLPPFLGHDPAPAGALSPYRTTLPRIASKMCGSDPPKAILRGLVAHRQQLDGIGLQVGFQWLSGSFVDNIEMLERRHPRDVDVVTFYHRPAGVSDADWQARVNANVNLFDFNQTKAANHCDAYFVDLTLDSTWIVAQARYWYGLFSHRRGGVWKGMLEIPLAVGTDDADAAALLGP